MKDFPVVFCSGGPQKQQFQFTPPHSERDLKFINSWRRLIRNTGDPVSRDSVELATLAVRRFREERKAKSVAYNMREIQNLIKDNPYCEVCMLVLVKAP